MGRYATYADREWPDRTTTDHRELGYAAREDPTLAWIILVIVIAAAILLA